MDIKEEKILKYVPNPNFMPRGLSFFNYNIKTKINLFKNGSVVNFAILILIQNLFIQ